MYARQPRFHVYRDRKGEWRWRLLAANGRTIADSGEGYAQKQGAQRAARMVIATVERIGHNALVERIKPLAKLPSFHPFSDPDAWWEEVRRQQ